MSTLDLITNNLTRYLNIPSSGKQHRHHKSLNKRTVLPRSPIHLDHLHRRAPRNCRVDTVVHHVVVYAFRTKQYERSKYKSPSLIFPVKIQIYNRSKRKNKKELYCLTVFENDELIASDTRKDTKIAHLQLKEYTH